MWIYTTQGFTSAVAHRDQPGHMLLRFRDPQSARLIAEALSVGYTESPPPADYGWRAVVSLGEFTRWLTAEAALVDYDNFKNACAKADPNYASALARVWHSTLDALEPNARWNDWARARGDSAFLGWHEDWDQVL